MLTLSSSPEIAIPGHDQDILVGKVDSVMRAVKFSSWPPFISWKLLPLLDARDGGTAGA